MFYTWCMKTAPDNWYETAIHLLTDQQQQRVWSVIVSIFGDLARRPGDRIGGVALTRIICGMGIKPEAIRVALHRLRKDGWIDSERSGRASFHHLTPVGRAESARASQRIYARDPGLPDSWHVLVSDDAGHGLDALTDTGIYVRLGRSIAVGPGPLPTGRREFLGFDANGFSVPARVWDLVCPAELNQACSELHDALNQVERIMPKEARLTALQIATLRSLLVHRWRRVLLRHPDLPGVFFPPSWRGAECRVLVSELLDRLPRPEPAALDQDSLSVAG